MGRGQKPVTRSECEVLRIRCVVLRTILSDDSRAAAISRAQPPMDK